MFTQPKKSGVSPGRKDHPKDYAVTIITSGCHFSGKLYCKGSTRIGGKVEGEIVSEGLLIIEEAAMISARVTAEDIVIQGQMKGRLEAHSKVELSPSCIYDGDIITPVLVIQEGAQFNGRASMDPNNMVERQTFGDADRTFQAESFESKARTAELPSLGPPIVKDDFRANL